MSNDHGTTIQEVEKVYPEYEFQDPAPSSISFNQSSTEMLRIGPDGFYVRGKKIPVDEKEGMAVFKAFKRFLIEAELRRPY